MADSLFKYRISRSAACWLQRVVPHGACYFKPIRRFVEKHISPTTSYMWVKTLMEWLNLDRLPFFIFGNCMLTVNTLFFYRQERFLCILRHESHNKEQIIANKAEKNPMTLEGFEPGPPGYKSNALPLSQRVYSLTQLSEIGYKRVGRKILRNRLN